MGGGGGTRIKTTRKKKRLRNKFPSMLLTSLGATGEPGLLFFFSDFNDVTNSG